MKIGESSTLPTVEIKTLRELAERNGWVVEPHPDGFVAHKNHVSVLVRDSVQPLVSVTHKDPGAEPRVVLYNTHNDAAVLLTR